MRRIRHDLAMALALCMALAGCNQKSPKPVPTEPMANAETQERAAETGGLEPGKFDKVLTISSSEPAVAINGVFLDGRPLKSSGLGTSQVRVLLVADPDEGNGTPCTSEGLEVRLLNAIILRPLTNFCDSGYELKVDAAKEPLPDPAPAAPEEFSWEIDGRGNDKMLYFGIPQTDATTFLATCRKGETRAQVKFFEEASNRPTVDIHGPGRLLRYGLNYTPPVSSEEPPINEIDLGMDDQFWELLGRGAALAYRIDRLDFRSLDTRGSEKKINDFIDWCRGD